MLYAIGDNMNGLAAFAMHGMLYVGFTAGPAIRRHVTLPLAAGAHRLVLKHGASGKRKGTGTLVLDDKQHEDTLDMSPTFLRLGGEGVDVGLDRKRKVSTLYSGRGTFGFTGHVRHVRVMPGAQAPGSLANRPEAQAQLD